MEEKPKITGMFNKLAQFATVAIGAVLSCVAAHFFLVAIGFDPIMHVIGEHIGEALGTLDWSNSIADFIGIDASHAGHDHGAFEHAIAGLAPAPAPTTSW